MSSRCERSSPIACIASPQQGQAVSAGSTTISTRGRCSGSEPRTVRRFSARVRFSAGSAFSCSRLGFGDGLFEVLQRKIELVGIELLRAPAELQALKLADQVAQAIILAGKLVALGGEPHLLGALGITLGPASTSIARSPATSLGRASGAEFMIRFDHGISGLWRPAEGASQSVAEPAPAQAGATPPPSVGRSAARTSAASRARRTRRRAAPRTDASPRRRPAAT